jgi:LacI family transcriptional regulator
MEPVKPRRGAKPTIYDVATSAGVSISTVSLALNSPDRVKGATLERIMAAVDDLGFTPKAEAVIRARRGVGRIGVIAPFTSFPTETGLRLNGILRGVESHGHEVVVFDQASAATSQLMSLPVSRKVDGLIIVSVPFDAHVEQRLADRSIPTVVLEIPHEGFSSVIIDHRGGGSMVGAFLTGRGHRRCAYVGHRQEHDYPSQSRQKLDGFAAALSEAPEIRNIEHSLTDAVAVGLELLGSPGRPTAVFAHDDLLAAGVLMAARQLSLHVPGDVAVGGFNDAGIAEPLGLTTVVQPFEHSGAVAAQVLLAQIAEPEVPRRSATLGVSLVERSTT